MIQVTFTPNVRNKGAFMVVLGDLTLDKRSTQIATFAKLRPQLRGKAKELPNYNTTSYGHELGKNTFAEAPGFLRY